MLSNSLSSILSNIPDSCQVGLIFPQKFVNINPVSLIVTAVRGSMQGGVTPTQIAYVFVSCAVLIAIFAPLTMYLYNHKNAD